ncbi:hypothetical protein [Streptomyces sp. NPDC056632]|uniref:hypothetical protein n=1 Tax=Streptomyces sp. NPDC056632 TaxID=3345884 RepID=UPI0036876608
MQMTEPLATTLAAVAPVILLVGVVDLDLRYRVVRDAMNRPFEPILSALANLPNEPSREDIEGLRQRVSALHDPSRRRLRVPWSALAMAVVWGLIVMALALTEVLCLVWLGTPKPKPALEARWALVGIISVSAGMAWVVLVPVLRILNAPMAPYTKFVLEMNRLAQRLPSQPSQREDA